MTARLDTLAGELPAHTPEPWARRLAPELLLLVATVALTLFYYVIRADTVGAWQPARGWTRLSLPPLRGWAHYPLAALVLGVIPAWVAHRLTGLGWRDLGLGLGNWRLGLAVVAIGVPLALTGGWLGAADPMMRAVYPLDPVAAGTSLHSFVPYALTEFLYYGAWEVLFRGVLLFGLARRLGSTMSVSVQTGMSVTAHFGRAFGETSAAIPGGLLFGAVTLRVGSIWYIAVVHWLLAVSMEWFIVNGTTGLALP